MSDVKIKWILVGAPNSGKTSLFNTLTGSSGEVMNYPGSTTTTHKAALNKGFSTEVTIIDTPGVYGINGNSPEEVEVRTALKEHKQSPIIFVMDCRFIEHRIQLLAKLLNDGYNCVAYCTHVEVAAADLYELHLTYGISFIDSSQVLAIKTLLYAVENIHAHATAPSQTSNTLKVQKSKVDLDPIFLHPILGFMFVILAMILIFSGVFFIAQPISDGVESFIDMFIYSLQLY